MRIEDVANHYETEQARLAVLAGDDYSREQAVREKAEAFCNLVARQQLALNALLALMDGHRPIRERTPPKPIITPLDLPALNREDIPFFQRHQLPPRRVYRTDQDIRSTTVPLEMMHATLGGVRETYFAQPFICERVSTHLPTPKSKRPTREVVTVNSFGLAFCKREGSAGAFTLMQTFETTDLTVNIGFVRNCGPQTLARVEFDQPGLEQLEQALTLATTALG